MPQATNADCSSWASGVAAQLNVTTESSPRSCLIVQYPAFFFSPPAGRGGLLSPPPPEQKDDDDKNLLWLLLLLLLLLLFLPLVWCCCRKVRLMLVSQRGKGYCCPCWSSCLCCLFGAATAR